MVNFAFNLSLNQTKKHELENLVWDQKNFNNWQVCNEFKNKIYLIDYK